MHPWQTLLALFLFAPLVVVAGSVYKWVDGDGVTHYSDQPYPGAEKIQLGTSVQTLAMPVPRSTPATGKSRSDAQATPATGYTSVQVSSPADGRTFTDEAIPIALEVTPQLQPGHTVTWYLNGAALDQTDLAFTLDHLDRGSYTLSAKISDAGGAPAATAPQVTFYVRQPSMLAPQSHRH